VDISLFTDLKFFFSLTGHTQIIMMARSKIKKTSDVKLPPKPITAIPQWYIQYKERQAHQKKGEMLSSHGLDKLAAILNSGEKVTAPVSKPKKERTA